MDQDTIDGFEGAMLVQVSVKDEMIGNKTTMRRLVCIANRYSFTYGIPNHKWPSSNILYVCIL